MIKLTGEDRLRHLIRMHGNDPADVFFKLQDKVIRGIIESMDKTERFCKLFMPNTFFRPFDLAHGQIFEVLDNVDAKKVVIIGSRGIGKSSIFSTAYPMKMVVFGQTEYMVPLASSLDTAIDNAGDVKSLLSVNTLIKALYGRVKYEPILVNSDGELADVKVKETQKSWYTSTDVVVTPRGPHTQCRGLKVVNINREAIIRPTLWLGDDIEKTNDSDSEDMRAKLKRWFFSDVMNTVDVSDNVEFNYVKADWRVILIGTKIHEDGLLANLMDLPDWDVVLLKLWKTTTVGVESNFPNFVSTEAIRKRIKTAEASDTLGLLYRECQAESIPDKYGAAFIKGWFKYFNRNDKWFLERKSLLRTAVIVDPARSGRFEDGHLSDTAIVAISIDSFERRIYVRGCVKDRFTPVTLYEAIYQMCLHVGTVNVAVETTGVHMFITMPLKDYFSSKKKTINLIEVEARMGKALMNGDVDKKKRIRALQPYYKEGAVWHEADNCGLLEAQLLSFPYGKLDVADATAYTIYLMDLEGGMLPMDFGEDAMHEASRLHERDLRELYKAVAGDSRYGYQQVAVKRPFVI